MDDVAKLLVRLERRFDPPQPLDAVLARARTADGPDFQHARARAGFVRGHLLDVVVHLPGARGLDSERDAVEAVTRALLGDATFERWIGSVSSVPAPRVSSLPVLNAPTPDTFELERLASVVEEAISWLLAGLPELPYARLPQAEDWLLFELEPEPKRDYAAQDDLVLATTRAPELVKSFLRGEPFFSGRFSRAGELFAYLKFESTHTDPAARLTERNRIEDQVGLALAPAFGAVIGNGLGLRYTYVLLALADPAPALRRIREAARQASAPSRTWLLFCDTDLSQHSLPLWPHSPPPLLPK